MKVQIKGICIKYTLLGKESFGSASLITGVQQICSRIFKKWSTQCGDHPQFFFDNMPQNAFFRDFFVAQP